MTTFQVMNLAFHNLNARIVKYLTNKNKWAKQASTTEDVRFYGRNTALINPNNNTIEQYN